MKKAVKDFFVRMFDLVVAGTMIFSAASLVSKKGNDSQDEKEENIDLPYRVFVTYKSEEKENSYSSYADVVRAYSSLNLQQTTDEYSSATEEVVETQPTSTSNDLSSDTTIVDSIGEETTENNDVEYIDDDVEVIEEDEEVLDILEDEGVNVSVIENIASVLDEDVLIHQDISNVANLTDYLYDIENDGISREFKIEFVKKVFNLSDGDIYVLYDKFLRMISGNPTTHPKLIVRDTLHYIFEENGLEDLRLLLHLDTGVPYGEMESIGSFYLQQYVNNEAGEAFDIMMNSLYYRQINDVPQQFKYDFILKNYNLDMDELHDFAACMMCEGIPGSYFDAYAVTGVPVNRTKSHRWTDGMGTDLMDQLKRTGQFGVYTNGTYKKVYGDRDLTSYPAYQGVVDCLFEGNALHLCTNFYSNACQRDDRIQFVNRGNNYFRELHNEYLSPEDMRPIEDIYANIMNDKDLVLRK